MSFMLFTHAINAQRDFEKELKTSHAKYNAKITRTVLFDNEILYINRMHALPFCKKVDVSESGWAYEMIGYKITLILSEIKNENSGYVIIIVPDEQELKKFQEKFESGEEIILNDYEIFEKDINKFLH